MNVVDPILFQCRVNAEQPAICAPGSEHEVITYAQLEFIINNLTRAMLPFGFEPGQIIGIRARDPIFHIGLIFALTRIGAVTVSFRGGSLPPEIGLAAAITDASEPVTGVKRLIRANQDWVKGNGSHLIDPRLVRATGHEICRLALTSGSTGESKGIALSHRMLLARNIQFAYAFGGHWPEHSRLYCDLEMSSEPAFRFLLYTLMRGGMVMFYGSDPMATLQSFDLFKIQNMVTSPRSLGEHLISYEQTGIRCCLDHILALGGSASPELLQSVWARMCPNVFSDYGTTEVGSVASADLREINEVPGCAGYVVPPARIEIVSEDGAPAAVNTEGIVRLQTPFMATGYIGLPEASARAFRDGWFYPGDFGYVSQEGLLVSTGRLENRLNVSGE